VGRSGRELLEEKVGYVWSIHLHNQWKKEFWKGGWMERLLEGYTEQLEEMERYGRVVKGRVGGGGGIGGGGGGGGGENSERVFEKRRFPEELEDGEMDPQLEPEMAVEEDGEEVLG